MENMETIIVTGSAGLIGSEVVRFYASTNKLVIGIDNDRRQRFFGKDASTEWNRKLLENTFPNHYRHHAEDIRDYARMEQIYNEHGKDITLVVHTAAQPSHDWAALDPVEDFTINANGTLVLLELARKYCPEAVFIYTSTNKVYGDNPNYLPLLELETRWEIEEGHKYMLGVDENMSIDHTKHSLFGVSKTAGDLLTQEYGKYFGLKTGVFRCGCLTGPMHSGTQLHGFLAYLLKCAVKKKKYIILGYKGKQVRDNIHSYDLVAALDLFYRKPKSGEVYNIGGSRFSNCSMLEAIGICEELTGNKINIEYSEKNRIGDHIWWISDVRKFRTDYPEWNYRYDLNAILQEMYNESTKKVL